MSEFNRKHLMKFLETSAGVNALRLAAEIVSNEMVSATKYYMGAPDGKYFEAKDFGENVVKAKKAYVTLNTIMGGETAEMDRFKEGKKQVPELLTPLGVKKMIHLFTHLYCFASGCSVAIAYETVRACRQSEVSEGKSIVGPLTSTTKLSVEEIMGLGYGNKNGLAICQYKFHEGAIVLDMEELGKDYLKPEEREVLLLMGNRLSARCQGYDDRYLGRDKQPALMYEIDVYSPEFGDIAESKQELRDVVYNDKVIDEIRKFYTALNEKSDFPCVPACYSQWKDHFQKMVFQELKKFS